MKKESFLRVGVTDDVYVVRKSGADIWLRSVPDPKTFLSMGGKWEEVKRITPEEFKKYKLGRPIESIKSVESKPVKKSVEKGKTKKKK